MNKEAQSSLWQEVQTTTLCRHTPTLSPHSPSWTTMAGLFLCSFNVFGPGWEPLSSPQKAHYVSSKPFLTFLVGVLSSVLTSEPNCEWWDFYPIFTEWLKHKFKPFYPSTENIFKDTLENSCQKLHASSVVAFKQDIIYIKLMPLF